MKILIKSVQVALLVSVPIAAIGLFVISQWGMGHFGRLTPDAAHHFRVNQHGLITYYDQREFFLLERLPLWVTVWGVLCATIWHALEKLKKLVRSRGDAHAHAK
jgi:hypothetical protein